MSVDHIRLLRAIEEGPFGSVHAGMDDILLRRVLVKTIPGGVDPGFRERLLDEARALSALAHPNIQRVYSYAETPDGDVFALEPVEGTTVAEAAASMTVAERVRIANAAASAIAAAHHVRVVHGALSPASVILTKSHEIRVIDFALTTTHVSAPREPGPDWLSPEQRRGEPATHASDMYALGLLLRFLFADGDSEMRAIIASLVQEAPSDRATAGFTVARLERLAERPRRRARIVASAVTLALLTAGAVKYTLDLRRERAAAVAAQADEELRRAQASALVTYMLDDLHDKLDAVGQLDILDRTTRKALTYFASLSPDSIAPRELASNAKALTNLGQVQLSQGDRAAAAKTFEQSVRLAEAGAHHDPGDDESRFALGRAHSWLGNALQLDGDVDRALAHMREFARTSDDLVQRHPRETRFLHEQAYAHGNIGTLLEQQEHIAEALAEYERAMAIKKQILALEPGDDLLASVAVSTNKIAVARQKLGRLEDARLGFEEELRIRETLLSRQPANKPWRRSLAICHDYLGALAVATGDPDAALRHFSRQRTIDEELTAFDPRNMDWQRDLAIANLQSGVALRMRGGIDAALESHAVADRLLQSVLARGTPGKSRLRDMANVQIEYARTLLAAGRAREASARADRAVAALLPMRDEPPAQRFLGDALLVQGEARFAQGDAAGARASWEDADAVARGLAARSSNPRVLDLHARILLRLGRTDLAQPVIEQLLATGYRNRELVLLWKRGKEET